MVVMHMYECAGIDICQNINFYTKKIEQFLYSNKSNNNIGKKKFYFLTCFTTISTNNAEICLYHS